MNTSRCIILSISRGWQFVFFASELLLLINWTLNAKCRPSVILWKERKTKYSLSPQPYSCKRRKTHQILSATSSRTSSSINKLWQQDITLNWGAAKNNRYTKLTRWIKKAINDHINGTQLSQTELKRLRNNLIAFHEEAIKCHHAIIDAVQNISERRLHYCHVWLTDFDTDNQQIMEDIEAHLALPQDH